MVAAVENRQSIQRIDLVIPSPDTSPVEEAKAHYTGYYKREQADSHPGSRRSLIERMGSSLDALPNGAIILDLGSGRGILEAEYGERMVQDRHRVITLDVAEIPKDMLLYEDRNRIHHVQASGTAMPFADHTFAMGVSNLAFDFMPSATRKELHRTVAPYADIFINMHHPDAVIPPNLDEQIRKMKKRTAQEKRYKKGVREQTSLALAALEFKAYLEANSILFSSEGQIQQALEEAGFSPINVGVKTVLGDKWWEVDAVNMPDRFKFFTNMQTERRSTMIEFESPATISETTQAIDMQRDHIRVEGVAISIDRAMESGILVFDADAQRDMVQSTQA